MTTDFDALVASLAADRLASRIWARDPAPFARGSADPGAREAVGQRLGWLGAPVEAGRWLSAARSLADGVRAEGLTDVVLLGMGGSSLCAEVLRDVPGPRHPGGCRLTVLDTTDERTVAAATATLAPSRALFVVASKSGSTVEVTALERYFWSVMEQALGTGTGRHFVAITDPATPLTAHAASRGYREVLLNAPDIGGRYSALSLFGLVPAALLGLDLDRLIASARRMAGLCEPDTAANPGLSLGAFMAAHAMAGRDKLTLLLPPPLRAVGPWIEQLVAESTGKQRLGVLPIVDEPPGAPAEYGHDRAFVAVGGDPFARALEAAGHPVFSIEASPDDLGGEFFRWEFATAVAGAALGVNPFDEPNVRDAKVRTQAQLDGRRQRGTFAIAPPFETRDGVLQRSHRSQDRALKPGQYLAILDYLPADPTRTAQVSRLRAGVRARAGVATTYGIGPRYLHSTGQYHKGGPDTGVFALITAADRTSTPVPGMDCTFGMLKYAQALGDFEALVAADRPVVHWHIDDAAADFGAILERMVRE